jgi:AraC-like DNA-binding protein
MRLATSESALRRHLKLENTGYRELLQEMRLTTALIQLMQTTQPVYQIAYDCGYQSVSRFTSNFHRRFGLPPRAFRDSVEGSEQNLAVSAHSRA